MICFDGDRPGIAAAHRAIDRILPVLKSGYSFNFCFLPDGKDPDDIVRGGGADAFLGEVAKARPLSEVLWEREVATARVDTPERRAALQHRIEAAADSIADATVRDHYKIGDELLRRGYDPNHVENIMRGNWLRILRATLPS